MVRKGVLYMIRVNTPMVQFARAIATSSINHKKSGEKGKVIKVEQNIFPFW